MKTIDIINHLRLLEYNCTLAATKLTAAAEYKYNNFEELSILSTQYLDSAKAYVNFLNKAFNSMRVYEIVNQYYNLGSRITHVESKIKVYEKDYGLDTIVKLDELNSELNKCIKDRINFLNKEWTHEST